MKPGTFTQMYVQLVFAVQNRDNLLSKPIRPKVFEYIGGILRDQKNKPIIINGTNDHLHILFRLNPAISVSDTVHDIKRGSSIFINSQRLIPLRFSWQEGYGGFTYSRSEIENVYRYIQNQEAHHAKQLFRDEYHELLRSNEIIYDSRFLFDFFDKFNEQE